jgi:hypothetical protein
VVGVGAHSDAPTSTGGSVQWKGEREETGEEGGYHYMFVTHPLPPWLAHQKNPLPNKIRENVQNYEIGSWGRGLEGERGSQIERGGVRGSNHRDGRGQTRVLAPAFLA